MTTQSITVNDGLKVEQKAHSHRIAAFDFTKGALVLFMVLFHWLNYFYGVYGAIYTYLRFLTPSFIFITGFLISHVHFTKYGTGSVKLSKRLFIRGLKLILLFLGLNLLMSPLVHSSFIWTLSSKQMAWVNLNAIFVIGANSGGEASKSASFTILVPIGYLLVLSSVLSLACKSFKYVFHAACILALLGMIVLDIHGMESSNLELITVGMLGVVLGYSSKQRIEQLADHTWMILLTYASYLAVITMWKVSYYIQMGGACLTTLLIYVIGVRTVWMKKIHSEITLLGRYSLFGYIAQIAILQSLSLVLRRFHGGLLLLAGSFVMGFALTFIAVEAMDWGRSRSKAIDNVYRAVFA